MIIYGTSGSHVRTVPQPDLSCPACPEATQLHLSIYSRYAHVYWIPLFPYTKPAIALCGHCQGAWELAELPAEATEVKQALREVKKQTAAPWWQWSGLALLLVGIVWAVVANWQDDQDNKDYLAAPRAGDIYTVCAADSTGARQYSLLKVIGAKGNSVELVANEYVTENAAPLASLNDPEKYSKTPFSLTQLDLQIMLNKGELTDVDRPDE